MSDLLPGVEAGTVDARIRIHHLTSGPADGEPVVLVHGNLSTGRFYEHLMSAGERPVAVPRAGHAGVRAHRAGADRRDPRARRLGRRPRLLPRDPGGHAARTSSAGRPPARRSRWWPGRSRWRRLTFLDPVSPYGYGGTLADGRPCFDDSAGSGAGVANPQFVEKLRQGDRLGRRRASPRNVMARHLLVPRLPPAAASARTSSSTRSCCRSSATTATRATPPTSSNWPGAGPGTRGS